jgi:hypothetical protein
MTTHSAASSFAGLRKIDSGMPIFPVSCIGAAISSVSHAPASQPLAAAKARE